MKAREIRTDFVTGFLFDGRRRRVRILWVTSEVLEPVQKQRVRVIFLARARVSSFSCCTPYTCIVVSVQNVVHVRRVVRLALFLIYYLFRDRPSWSATVRTVSACDRLIIYVRWHGPASRRRPSLQYVFCRCNRIYFV